MIKQVPEIEKRQLLVSRQNLPPVIYWLLPFALFFLQLLFTINSTGQIRYEELAESVRNVFWLENYTIYDGISSNVGWYGTLLIFYKIFGFTLNSAKIFRLVLALISLISLAIILKKFLGEKIAWLPLVTIGLSPTLLYFNTLQTSFGIDLQYFPICLYLLISLDFKNRWKTFFRLFFLGFLSMVAWMSYPTFVYYLIPLGLIYIHKIWSERRSIKFYSQIVYLTLVLSSFLLPLVFALFYLKDASLLIHDPKTQGGIFRGAGIFYPDINNFFFNIGGALNDLFSTANSYYFEVASTEFSGIYPVVTILLLFIASIMIFKDRKQRLVVALIYILLFLSIILSNLTFDPSGHPGIRRNTPILVSLYSLFTLTWYKVFSLQRITAGTKRTLILILLLLPLHHLIAFPINLLSLNNPSPYAYTHIFGIASTPGKSLELFVEETIKNDLKLGCKDKDNNLVYCRYQEGYAAIAGSCLWNSLDCHQILGYDPKLLQFIPVKISLWETYYWEH